MRSRLMVYASMVVALSGCSPAFWQGVSQGLAAATPSGTKLMIFGGPGHQTYLGCLSCSEYDTESIFNEYGTYGSPYSAQSIRNPYSSFGSPYSATSACNPYASDPPVIVDGNGKYYGRLTVNTYRTDGPPTDQLRAWIAAVCAH
jgi:hypothetical protein